MYRPIAKLFHYLPDLEQLILFDNTDRHLIVLDEAIDSALARVDA